jgi:hypothetical protein
MKITHYITVTLITGKISQNDRRLFGQGSADSFPGSDWAGVFLNSQGEVVGADSSLRGMSFGSDCVAGSAFQESLKQLVPFLSFKDSNEWLFGLSNSVEADSILQYELPEGVSVGFTWSGDARDLEASLQDEVGDEWEDELSSFDEMFQDGRIIGIGKKDIFETTWNVSDLAGLEDKRGDGDWQRTNEFCFIVRSY